MARNTPPSGIKEKTPPHYLRMALSGSDKNPKLGYVDSVFFSQLLIAYVITKTRSKICVTTTYRWYQQWGGNNKWSE